MRPAPFTGYETQARDVGHYFHGIRGTKTRDTRHAIHGIRDTALTGYGAQEKLLKWPGGIMQYGFQDSEKIS